MGDQLIIGKIGDLPIGSTPMFLIEDKSDGTVYKENLDDFPFPMGTPPAAYTIFTVRYLPERFVWKVETKWFIFLIRCFDFPTDFLSLRSIEFTPFARSEREKNCVLKGTRQGVFDFHHARRENAALRLCLTC